MKLEAPIEFFNRRTGRVETERVYGEAFLRWIYGRPLGRAALHTLVKRAGFSRFYGWLMDSERSRDLMAPFIETYGLDPSDFADEVGSFASFNEFFYRRLRPDRRPVDPDPDTVVFPADGRHLAVPDAGAMDGFFVKGQTFDLAALLGDPALAERFARGSLILSRLCPVDYHRFHFPVCGVPGVPRLLPGPLFSVSPLALRRRLAYLWENKRVLTEVRTERFGLVLVLEIGATNVGSMIETFVPDRPVAKGAEKGYFRFGGSSVITLFEPGRVCLAADLVRESSRHREVYAWVGETMGCRAGVGAGTRAGDARSGEA
jgi:phosphatidylserine decarboxylase